jgi:hypothetical protein
LKIINERSWLSSKYYYKDCAKILLEMQNLDEKIGCPICRKTLRESLFDSYNPYARHI